MPHSLALRLRRRLSAPGALPLRIRTFLSGLCMAFFLGIGIFQPSFTKGLAYAGILFGIGGSSVLYWETGIAPDEVTRLANHIASAGHSPNLSKSERDTVFLIAVMGLVCGSIIAFTMWAVNQQSPNPERFAWRLTGCAAYAIIPSLSIYYMFKQARQWLHSQATLLRDPPYEEAVKRYFRSCGFMFLVIAGLLQIPDLLLSSETPPAAKSETVINPANAEPPSR